MTMKKALLVSMVILNKVIELGSHIWHNIYKYNAKAVKFPVPCEEDKLLYKLVSGIQTAINMHITQYYGDVHTVEHHPDHAAFNFRVGSHKEYIDNLYFTYRFMLTAYDKLRSDLPDYVFTHNNKTENSITKGEMKELEKKFLATDFVNLGDEDLLTTVSKKEFVEVVQPIFFNITQLLDCTTCEK